MAAATAKAELPVQPQISGTQAYVCPRIPKELIGHTELAYSGPDNPPSLHLCGQGPKENHIIRKTINYSHRLPKDAFDADNYVQVNPLPENSPDFHKFKQLLEIVAKKLENSPFKEPQCDQVVRELPIPRVVLGTRLTRLDSDKSASIYLFLAQVGSTQVIISE